MWESYRIQGTVKNDAHLIAMMEDCASTANALRTINERYYAIVINDLVRTWFDLNTLATQRGLLNVPGIVK